MLSFTDLPPEIRNKIYRINLVDAEPLSFHRNDYTTITTGVRVNRAHALQPQLLAVNKQIRNEAAGILYGDNTFNFLLDPVWSPTGGFMLDWPTLSHFLFFIGPANRKAIRYIRLPRFIENLPQTIAPNGTPVKMAEAEAWMFTVSYRAKPVQLAENWASAYFREVPNAKRLIIRLEARRIWAGPLHSGNFTWSWLAPDVMGHLAQFQGLKVVVEFTVDLAYYRSFFSPPVISKANNYHVNKADLEQLRKWGFVLEGLPQEFLDSL